MLIVDNRTKKKQEGPINFFMEKKGTVIKWIDVASTGLCDYFLDQPCIIMEGGNMFVLNDCEAKKINRVDYGNEPPIRGVHYRALKATLTIQD